HGNDAAPFQLPGQAQVITRADYPGPQVPAALHVLENAVPRPDDVTAVMTFRVGGGLEAPGRVSVTRWPGLLGGLEWDVPVLDGADDSAAVLYWQPTHLAPGTGRRVGYAYGLGAVHLVR